MTALAPLRGVVVIDEIQRRPDLFPFLRVLADRRPPRARFLILGSATPDLLRQSSETIPAATLLRFWTMLAHYHGGIWNAAEVARSLGVTEPTARRYLDLLSGLFMV